jgi:hypothetical protein
LGVRDVTVLIHRISTGYAQDIHRLLVSVFPVFSVFSVFCVYLHSHHAQHHHARHQTADDQVVQNL